MDAAARLVLVPIYTNLFGSGANEAATKDTLCNVCTLHTMPDVVTLHTPTSVDAVELVLLPVTNTTLDVPVVTSVLTLYQGKTRLLYTIPLTASAM